MADESKAISRLGGGDDLLDVQGQVTEREIGGDCSSARPLGVQQQQNVFVAAPEILMRARETLAKLRRERELPSTER